MISCLGLCQLVTVCLCVRLQIASGQNTFYIVTSSSSPCPGEFVGVPCLTLREYASNPSRSQNITFLVEPGYYNLSTILSVSNGYNFTMSSTNAIVTCTSTNARFIFDTVEKVYISGMTFQGCHTAIRMTSVTSGILTDSRFVSNRQLTLDSNYNDGGGLQVISSSVEISDCDFRNNRAYDNGGAIYATSSNITIDTSVLSNNRALDYGGAIYATSSNVTIDTSVLSNNLASDNGGAIYAISSNVAIDRSVLSNNIAYGNGGAIYVYIRATHTFSVSRSSFTHNTAAGYRDSGGAAIYVYEQNYRAFRSTVTKIDRSVFSDNNAEGRGGAIYYYYSDNYQSTVSSSLRIYRSEFNRNSARRNDGGAICIDQRLNRPLTIDRNLSLIHCQLTNNTAGGRGGAVYKNHVNDSLLINQTYFTNNTANSFGGALYVEGTNSSIDVTASSFLNNTATREGGGAIYSNGLNANVTLSSSTFINNSASYCAVLDVDNFNHFSVNLTNSVFKYNTATGRDTLGGGVACIRNASINILNSTFRHNSANNHAGVFFIDESLTTVDGSSFINNTAALDGGVFYTYLYASDYIIRRSQFSENSAGDDGGVMLIGYLNSFVSIDESVFDSNSAGDRGGVIAIIASSMHMEFNHTNIFNNTAQFGGVISACNSQITIFGESLNVTVDPVLPFCMLYEGDINDFNMTLPPATTVTAQLITTEPPPTTTELPTTTEPATTVPTTTEMLTETEETVTSTRLALTTEPLATTEEENTSELLTTSQPVTTTEMVRTTETLNTTEGVTTSEMSTSESTEPVTAREPLKTTTDTATTASESEATTEPVTLDNVPPVTTQEETIEPKSTDSEIDTTSSNKPNIDTTASETVTVVEKDFISKDLFMAFMILSAFSSAGVLVAIFMSALAIVLHFCPKKQHKAKPEKQEPSKPLHADIPTFIPNSSLAYTSPIYNPCYDEAKN